MCDISEGGQIAAYQFISIESMQYQQLNRGSSL